MNIAKFINLFNQANMCGFYSFEITRFRNLIPLLTILQRQGLIKGYECVGLYKIKVYMNTGCTYKLVLASFLKRPVKKLPQFKILSTIKGLVLSSDIQKGDPAGGKPYIYIL